MFPVNIKQSDSIWFWLFSSYMLRNILFCVFWSAGTWRTVQNLYSVPDSWMRLWWTFSLELLGFLLLIWKNIHPNQLQFLNVSRHLFSLSICLYFSIPLFSLYKNHNVHKMIWLTQHEMTYSQSVLKIIFRQGFSPLAVHSSATAVVITVCL